MDSIVAARTDTAQRGADDGRIPVPPVHPRSPKSTARRGTRRMAPSLRQLMPRALSRHEATEAMLEGSVDPASAHFVWNVGNKPVLQEAQAFTTPNSVDLLPARRIGTHPDAPNRVSHFATVRDGLALMLEAESRLEMHHLRVIDMDPQVTMLQTQPMVVIWPYQGAAILHVPDILAIRRSQPVVVDVKPDALQDEYCKLTFALTSTSLAVAGVEHRVGGSVSRQCEMNYRAVRRWKLADPNLKSRIEAVQAEQPATAHHLLSICGDTATGREVFFHLIANGQCQIDMNKPIHRATRISWVLAQDPRRA